MHWARQVPALLLPTLLLASCTSPGRIGDVEPATQERATEKPAGTAAPPYPQSEAIADMEFHWASHKRFAPGSDNWPMTWSANGDHYTAFGDGGGFGGDNRDGRVSLGVARVEGKGASYSGFNIWGGKGSEVAATFKGKSYGILAIGTDLYLWRCGDASGAAAYRFQRLYRSDDDGRSWREAGWQFPGDLTFYCPTFLQFGKGYEGARDGYVYTYANERDKVARLSPGPGRIMLMRAPKDRLMDRAAYEFFAGTGATGIARWTSEVADRVPVFKDANGTGLVSAAYNPSLRRYLLATQHAPKGQGNIGIFDAPSPWGPWTTVLYEDGWGTERFRAGGFFWNFAPGWWSDDGRDFVLVFTGTKALDSWNTVEGSFIVGGPPVAWRGDVRPATEASAPDKYQQALLGRR